MLGRISFLLFLIFSSTTVVSLNFDGFTSFKVCLFLENTFIHSHSRGPQTPGNLEGLQDPVVLSMGVSGRSRSQASKTIITP